MKKGLFILAMMLVVLAGSAYAKTGIGISPSCYDFKDGKCEFAIVDEPRAFEFHIYNYDNDTKRFSMAANDPRVLISPSEFEIGKDNRLGCGLSPGCQIVNVTIMPQDFEYGKYVVELKATTSLGGGFVNINQVIGSKLYFNVIESSAVHNSSSEPKDPIDLSFLIWGLALLLAIVLAVLIYSDYKREMIKVRREFR